MRRRDFISLSLLSGVVTTVGDIAVTLTSLQKALYSQRKVADAASTDPYLPRAPWLVRGQPRQDRQRAFARSSSGAITGRASPSSRRRRVPGGSLAARDTNQDSVQPLCSHAPDERGHRASLTRGRCHGWH